MGEVYGALWISDRQELQTMTQWNELCALLSEDPAQYEGE